MTAVIENSRHIGTLGPSTEHEHIAEHPSLATKVKQKIQGVIDTARSSLAYQDDKLIRERGLVKLVWEDLARQSHDWTRPGFRALAIYRFGVWTRTLGFLPLRAVCALVHTLLFRHARNHYGIEIYHTAKIGRRFLIGHQGGIVIHKYATFGDDCVIRQCVTFGEGGINRDNFGAGLGPVVGDSVDIGAGVVVIGNVTIGSHVNIGPNAVILMDIPGNMTVMAPHPKMMPRPSQ